MIRIVMYNSTAKTDRAAPSPPNEGINSKENTKFNNPADSIILLYSLFLLKTNINSVPNKVSIMTNKGTIVNILNISIAFIASLPKTNRRSSSAKTNKPIVNKRLRKIEMKLIFLIISKTASFDTSALREINGYKVCEIGIINCFIPLINLSAMA